MKTPDRLDPTNHLDPIERLDPIELGALTIHRIIEEEPLAADPIFTAGEFFPSLTAEQLSTNSFWLEPDYIDPHTNTVALCLQSYVVRTPHHIILIDACAGNHKPRPTVPFWNMLTAQRYEHNLGAAGFSFSQIDYVLCTHLHVDHVGWNTRFDDGQWVPTFPNATYIFAEDELTYWIDRQARTGDCPWITDSVLPIINANQGLVVASSHKLNDLVQLIPTPGHTVDHYAVHIGTEEDGALFTGDLMHSPLQVRYPDLGHRADYDSVLSSRSRRAIFERFSDTPTLICPAHFPSPSLGYLIRSADGFSFTPFVSKTDSTRPHSGRI